MPIARKMIRRKSRTKRRRKRKAVCIFHHKKNIRLPSKRLKLLRRLLRKVELSQMLS